MRITALLLALIMAFAAVPALAETDAVSSASVADYYADAALTGDELMNAINSFTGTYLVSTTNPDGTPNTAFFVFSMIKHEDAYYIQLGLAPNQSVINLEANGKGMCVYGMNPGEGDKPYPVKGARIWFDSEIEPAVLEALKANAREGAMFYRVTEVRPVG